MQQRTDSRNMQRWCAYIWCSVAIYIEMHQSMLRICSFSALLPHIPVGIINTRFHSETPSSRSELSPGLAATFSFIFGDWVRVRLRPDSLSNSKRAIVSTFYTVTHLSSKIPESSELTTKNKIYFVDTWNKPRYHGVGRCRNQ